MATLITEWGVNDCLTDLFGDDAHEKLKLDFENHDDAFEYVSSLTKQKRLDLFRTLGLNNNWQRYYGFAQPGDAAIGNFQLAVNRSVELPCPWYAMMGVDYLWYVRMPKSIRPVEHDGRIEVYRRCQPQH